MNKNILDLLVGGSGIVLSAISLENLSTIVGIICSVAIALTTCGIQIYRMIRDRDEDKKEKQKEEQKEE